MLTVLCFKAIYTSFLSFYYPLKGGNIGYKGLKLERKRGAVKFLYDFKIWKGLFLENENGMK